MFLRYAPSSRWRRKFSASAQMSELSRKTVRLKAAGRLFQMAAAETAKSLAPMTVLVAVLTVSGQSATERSSCTSNY